MRASRSQHHAPPPQPLPLPPPPLSLPSSPAAPRRGRHRSSHSSSSSSSSSVSSASASTSTFFCPSPSPAQSPRGSTSLVPFSWERHPGVPKNSVRGGLAASPTAGTPLPLPPAPLLRPAPRRRRRRQRAKAPDASSSSNARDDPFAAALTECTREYDYTAEDADDDHHHHNKLWPVPAKPAGISSGRAERRWWTAGGGGGLVAFLDMHGCKSAMDVVADGAACHPRRLVVAAADPRPAIRPGTSR